MINNSCIANMVIYRELHDFSKLLITINRENLEFPFLKSRKVLIKVDDGISIFLFTKNCLIQDICDPTIHIRKTEIRLILKN